MKNFALILIFAFIGPFSFTHAQDTKASPELVVHLLDYLAKDYGGAVQNGKVVSPSEYAEQIEFADIVGKNASGVEKLKVDQEFSAEIRSLQEMIRSKASADDVSRLARKLQQDAINLAEIDVAPVDFQIYLTGQEFIKQAVLFAMEVRGMVMVLQVQG